MFNLKYQINNDIVENFIKNNHDNNLNFGNIKKIEHPEFKAIEIDASRTELKMNYLYVCQLTKKKDYDFVQSIIAKYEYLNQVVSILVWSETETILVPLELEKNYRTTLRAMRLSIENHIKRNINLPSDFVLKLVEWNDIDSFIEVINSGFGIGNIDTSKYETLIKESKISNNSELIILYNEEQKPVATGNIYFEADIAVIDDISVHAQFRSKGYASIIMNKLIESAIEKKYKIITLFATVDGLPVYEKIGFVPTGLNGFIYK